MQIFFSMQRTLEWDPRALKTIINTNISNIIMIVSTDPSTHLCDADLPVPERGGLAREPGEPGGVGLPPAAGGHTRRSGHSVEQGRQTRLSPQSRPCFGILRDCVQGRHGTVQTKAVFVQMTRNLLFLGCFFFFFFCYLCAVKCFYLSQSVFKHFFNKHFLINDSKIFQGHLNEVFVCVN